MSTERTPDPDDVGAIALLDEPVRRALYEWVVAQERPVGRDEAATSLGITRALATFHLDRLADGALLDSGYKRLGERRGPGAGRPARVYWRADRDFAISLPDRRYERVARMLARGAEGSARGGQVAREAARAAGGAIGRRARRDRRRSPVTALRAALESEGYEGAVPDPDGVIRLRNCPYDALVEEHRSLVCGMNLAMAEGLVDAVGADDSYRPILDPQPGRCCVAFVPRRD